MRGGRRWSDVAIRVRRVSQGPSRSSLIPSPPTRFEPLKQEKSFASSRVRQARHRQARKLSLGTEGDGAISQGDTCPGLSYGVIIYPPLTPGPGNSERMPSLSRLRRLTYQPAPTSQSFFKNSASGLTQHNKPQNPHR